MLSLKCPFWEKKAWIVSIKWHRLNSNIQQTPWALLKVLVRFVSFYMVCFAWCFLIDWNSFKNLEKTFFPGTESEAINCPSGKCVSWEEDISVWKASGVLEWIRKAVVTAKNPSLERSDSRVSPLAAGHWLKLWLSPYLSEVATSCMTWSWLWEDRMGLYSLGFGNRLCQGIAASHRKEPIWNTGRAYFLMSFKKWNCLPEASSATGQQLLTSKHLAQIKGNVN